MIKYSGNVRKWFASSLIFFSMIEGTPAHANEKVVFTPARCVHYQPVVIKPHPAPFQLQVGNASSLESAYQAFLKTGKAPNIITEGFVQFAYGAQQPIVATSPFELSVISLEPGEQITNVSSGDPMRWSYSLAYSGDKARQAHVMVKPSLPHISTDLVITTDKRFYTLKLVSRQTGHYYRDVRFWYPNDIQKKVDLEIRDKATKIERGDSPFEDQNQFDAAHLNFDYQIKSPFFERCPRWIPTRVFDDGRQTYLQFPHNVAQTDLPALFVKQNKQMLMANYRVKAPYFIVDRVFDQAVLIAGTGRDQQRITVINQHDMR